MGFLDRPTTKDVICCWVVLYCVVIVAQSFFQYDYYRASLWDSSGIPIDRPTTNDVSFVLGLSCLALSLLSGLCVFQ